MHTRFKRQLRDKGPKLERRAWRRREKIPIRIITLQFFRLLHHTTHSTSRRFGKMREDFFLPFSVRFFCAAPKKEKHSKSVIFVITHFSVNMLNSRVFALIKNAKRHNSRHGSSKSNTRFSPFLLCARPTPNNCCGNKWHEHAGGRDKSGLVKQSKSAVFATLAL
jgi:hypothetical protein